MARVRQQSSVDDDDSPQSPEIIVSDSDAESDPDQRDAKRRRIENISRLYRAGLPVLILSASLRGPFNSAWRNPWAKVRDRENSNSTVDSKESLALGERGNGTTLAQPKHDFTNIACKETLQHRQVHQGQGREERAGQIPHMDLGFHELRTEVIGRHRQPNHQTTSPTTVDQPPKGRRGVPPKNDNAGSWLKTARTCSPQNLQISSREPTPTPTAKCRGDSTGEVTTVPGGSGEQACVVPESARCREDASSADVTTDHPKKMRRRPKGTSRSEALGSVNRQLPAHVLPNVSIAESTSGGASDTAQAKDDPELIIRNHGSSSAWQGASQCGKHGELNLDKRSLASKSLDDHHTRSGSSVAIEIWPKRNIMTSGKSMVSFSDPASAAGNGGHSQATTFSTSQPASLHVLPASTHVPEFEYRRAPAKRRRAQCPRKKSEPRTSISSARRPMNAGDATDRGPDARIRATSVVLAGVESNTTMQIRDAEVGPPGTARRSTNNSLNAVEAKKDGTRPVSRNIDPSCVLAVERSHCKTKNQPSTQRGASFPSQRLITPDNSVGHSPDAIYEQQCTSGLMDEPSTLFCTQAAVEYAERLLQAEIETPAKPQRADPDSSLPSPPPNNPTYDAPDRGLRELDLETPNRAAPESFSTQALLDAATPFVLSTIKRPWRAESHQMRGGRALFDASPTKKQENPKKADNMFEKANRPMKSSAIAGLQRGNSRVRQSERLRRSALKPTKLPKSTPTSSFSISPNGQVTEVSGMPGRLGLDVEIDEASTFLETWTVEDEIRKAVQR